MDFKVTVKGDHICLDKVLSPEKVVTLPSFIDGLPVRELGSYALSGTAVEEIYLPPWLERTGAYAFYGCDSLRIIHAFGRALDLGAGVFAGDRRIALLDIWEFPGEASCLKEMLSEIRQTLRVRLHRLCRDVFDEEESRRLSFENAPAVSGGEARLVFPEYFEESVENTPARQLIYEMHGCGQRYRYSFVNREFRFSEYDSLFPYAENEADERTAAELAIGRLRFPRELTPEAEKMYEEYLCTNWKTAAEILIEADECGSMDITNLEPETLPWLLEDIIKPDEDRISFITDLARERRDTAMVSYCMDYAHRNTRKEDAPEGGKTRRRRFGLT